MKLEEFPVITFNGQKLLAVPELPKAEWSTGDHRCEMCYREHQNCGSLSRTAAWQLDGDSCDGMGVIFLPEDNFREYVVEFVRRRVS